MCHIVIVRKPGSHLIVTSSEHATRCFLLWEFLDVYGSVGGVWREGTDHFLVFAHPDAFALDDLDVFETREDVVLDNKFGFHLVFTAFFDGEGLLTEFVNCTSTSDIDTDVRTAMDLLVRP